MKSLSFFAVVILFSNMCFSAVLSELRVYGSSKIKNSNADMWDKKNDAVADAKGKATYMLARKVLKPTVYENSIKRIKKEIIPYSSRYLISSEVKSHGAEEESGGRFYNAQVVFKYSLENLKSLLKNRGFAVADLKRHKVAAFIEVLDVTTVKSYLWWSKSQPEVHPVLKPLHKKLKSSLAKSGYDLATIKFTGADRGLKYMANSMGAQYYVDGSVRIEKTESGGYKVIGGIFNFHETLSQKLVSSVDLQKFKKQRSIASTEKIDPLNQALEDAAKKMHSSENTDRLDQGLAKINFVGVMSPVQLKNIKEAIMMKLESEVSTLTERRIENGQVTFQARTTLPPRKLLLLMNARLVGLGISRGVLKEDGKTLSFRSAN